MSWSHSTPRALIPRPTRARLALSLLSRAHHYVAQTASGCLFFMSFRVLCTMPSQAIERPALPLLSRWIGGRFAPRPLESTSILHSRSRSCGLSGVLHHAPEPSSVRAMLPLPRPCVACVCSEVALERRPCARKPPLANQTAPLCRPYLILRLCLTPRSQPKLLDVRLRPEVVLEHRPLYRAVRAMLERSPLLTGSFPVSLLYFLGGYARPPPSYRFVLVRHLRGRARTPPLITGSCSHAACIPPGAVLERHPGVVPEHPRPASRYSIVLLSLRFRSEASLELSLLRHACEPPISL
ncbi:hypothetical protein C8J57DRAFT_1524885 [Mycena rebaudengoi]|nr:hypothetical protein C8J57DRAFT_1524885 [Mycena rebaudengoi]